MDVVKPASSKADILYAADPRARPATSQLTLTLETATLPPRLVAGQFRAMYHIGTPSFLSHNPMALPAAYLVSEASEAS